MTFWLFSSRNIENIKVAKDELLWGFWDKEAGRKQKQNWKAFIKLYNKIKPFDIVILQIAKTEEIHAIGIVRETYYDDQTLVWPQEKEQERVLYPWRVSFCSIIFSNEPFTSHFVRIENYVDGYEIGELSEHEFRNILSEIKKQIRKQSKLDYDLR